jgi:hypothetical protein
LDAEGLDAEGLDAEGLGAEGLDAEGLDAEGLDAEGLGAEGLDAEGLDAEGLDAEGLDAEGLDAEGLDADGLAAEIQSLDQLESERHMFAQQMLRFPEGVQRRVVFAPQTHPTHSNSHVNTDRMAGSSASTGTPHVDGEFGSQAVVAFPLALELGLPGTHDLCVRLW